MKFRKISLLLVFVLLISLFATTALADKQTIGTLNAYDSYGTMLTDVKNLKSASVRITLEKEPGEQLYFFVASYDNGFLYDVNFEVMSPGALCSEVAVRFPGTSTQKVKAYLWDTKMNPVSEIFTELSHPGSDPEPKPEAEIYKLSGFVSANSVSYIEGASNTDEGKINFTMTSEMIGKYEDTPFAFTTAEAANGQKTIKNLLVGETDVDKTLALATDIYVTQNVDNKYEVIDYVLRTDKNNTESIKDPTDIQAFGNASKSSKWDAINGIYYLSVYDADTDTTNTTYSLDVNAKLLLNGNNIGLVSANLANYINTFSASTLTTYANTALGYVYAPTNGTVDLIDSDDDGYYEYVKVESYETAVMDDDPYGNNTKISTTAGTINLDFGNRTNASYSIVLNGEAVDVADLKKYDVLSVAKTDAYHWTIIASRSTVEGQISECDTTSFDMSDWQLVIDGKIYVIANLYSLGDAGLAGVNAGDEGIFYLDAFGNIALYDPKSSNANNYGFVVAAGQYSSVGDTEYQVRILDKDGNTNTYVLAENVKLTDLDNAISGQTTPAATVFNNYIATMPLFQTGHACDLDYAVWTLKANGSYVDAQNNAVTTIEAMTDNYAGRIITFSLNSADKISSITIAKNGVDYENFSLATSASTLTYKAKTLSFAGSYGVTADTVIFNLPITNNASKDDFHILSTDILEDNKLYTVALFDINENVNAGMLVITNNEIEYDEPILPSTDKGYGFVVAAGQYSSVGDTEYQVRILDKDGNTNTYVLAENVKLTDLDGGINGLTTPAATVFNNYIATMPLFQPGHTCDLDYAVWTLKANGSYVDAQNNAVTTIEAMTDNYAGRIITFSLNSADKISSITVAKNGVDYKNFSIIPGAANLTYKAKTLSFAGSYGIAEDTVIFNLPITSTSSKDDFYVSSTDILEDNKLYTVSLFDINENGNAGMLVITNNEIEYDEPILPSTDKGYGFVVAAGQYSSVGDTEYEVRVLDKDGNTNTYVLAENVRITDLDNAISGQTTPAATVFNNYIATMPLFQTGHACDLDYAVWTLKANGSYVDAQNNAVTTIKAMTDNYAGRIITFSLNSADKISSITIAKNGVDYENFSLTASAAELTYKAKTLSFAGSYGIAEDAVIFNLPITNNSTKDDFSVISVSSLEDDEKYVVALFSVNEDGNARAMVTTSDFSRLNLEKNLAVVSKVITTNNSAGERIYAVTFIQNGEEKTLATTNDVFNSTTFSKGAVFEYSIDNDGAIDKVAFDGADNNPLDVYEIAGKNYSAIFNENSNAKVQYVFGAVCNKYASTRIINLVSYVAGGTTVDTNIVSNIGRHFIPAEAQVVVIDCTKSNTATNKVVVGSFGDIQSSRWINDQVDEDSDYAVLLRYYKETVTDVIVYKHYVNKVYYGN